MKKINAKIGVITILGNCSYLGNLTERGMVMCEFCKKIIKTDKEYFDARVNGGDFIFQNDESFCVLIDTGDSGCLGCLDDIKYCPMCGRELRK